MAAEDKVSAEELQAAAAAGGQEAAEDTPGYKPPAEKSIDQILNQDKEDPSLEKYKATLLGDSAKAVPFPEDPRHVIVKSLSLVVEGRDDVTLDLSGDLSALKNQSFCLKEGSTYRLKVNFFVQREIVSGLRLVQKTYRKSIKVETSKLMVGSYGPKVEVQCFVTPGDEAPSGMLARGHYTVQSLFTDDDKKEYLKWEWSFDIKKDWH